MKPSPRVWTLVAMCLGAFMAQLDINVVNLALPSMQRALGGSIGALQWIVDAYNLAFAILLLSGGLLGDRLGRRGMFALGIVIFTAGSLLCGLAANHTALIAGRAVQGVGAAFALPGTLAILSVLYETPEDRARAVAAWASMAGLAIAVGPTVGALLIDTLGWQSIFLINIPIGLATIALVYRVVPVVPPHRRTGLDWAGQVLFGLCLGGLTLASIESRDAGWHAPIVLVSFAVSIAALLLFLRAERSSAKPMVPLDLFQARAFTIPLVLTALMTFGMYGMLFATTLYLQSVRGASAVTAGLQLLPMSVAFIVTSQLGGRLQQRFGARAFMVSGMATMALGMFVLASMAVREREIVLLASFVLLGVGMGLNTATVVGAAVAGAPSEKAGVAAALANAARMVGATLGVALLGALLPAAGAGKPAFLHGMELAVSVAGAGMLFGSLLALFGLAQQQQARTA
jgi:MFS transporter, DHA2 family, methylenomycin A resistance protein